MDPGQVAAAAQLACLLEVSAPKPGNVSPGQHFHDTRYEDFLASAVAIGPAIAAAECRTLGQTIRAAVEATARWTRSNTNLGIILLLGPLARAALRSNGEALRPALSAVLGETTVDDAQQVYAAIRHAAPGGLGRVPEQDVATPPTVTLREAMALAADRDSIAREYISDFAITFEIGAPAVRAARRDGLDWADTTVETYLSLLSETPDTHIARKLGGAAAIEVMRLAREVRELGGVRTTPGRASLSRLDAELRNERNTRNPGTAADLTAAALFVILIENGLAPS